MKKQKEKKELTLIERTAKRLLTLDECREYYKQINTEAVIQLYLPYLSPSINHMYLNVSHGRIKKPSVSKYLNEIKQYLATTYATTLPKINPNAFYTLKIAFILKYENFYTKTYPKADSPLQRDDIDNRVKSIKDIICEFVGIQDDTQILKEIVSKRAAEKEGMYIELEEVAPRMPVIHAAKIDNECDELERVYLNNCINFREKGIISNGNSTPS